ncbi:hypothetical protein BH09PSE1_BH09PSE1_03610 [soil metagenome]
MTMQTAPLPRRDAPASAVVGIARLARATGVTPRALRHYESLGLLRSQRTRTGARVFTPHQCEVASTIALLRKLDVALPDILPIVDGARPEQDRLNDLRASLERKAEDLALRLGEVRAAIAASAAGQPQ